MFAKVNSVGLYGMNAFSVSVETSVERGMERFEVVGLPDASVSESRERVRTAIKSSGLHFPSARIVVNLAPGDIRKEGPVYDLPILVSLLIASEQINCDLSQSVFIGELSLSGKVRPVKGCLSMVIHAQEQGYKTVFIPAGNAFECSVVRGIDIYSVVDINKLMDHFTGKKSLTKVGKNFYNEGISPLAYIPDFADVKGQYEARRALEVAAAGGHNVLMVGPPGSGKSMLAQRTAGILPSMTFEESLETTKLYSVAGLLDIQTSLITTRPFRAPHHSISTAGLAGGGKIPRPGEVSLAHNGVLFLDELPEFSKNTLEGLRQPLEDGEITISRAMMSLTYPCNDMVIAAMNPCACGYYGSPKKKCICPAGAPQKYMAKVSGPLLDRLDIHIEVPAVEFDKLSDSTPGESSESIRKRVDEARKIQQQRFKGTSTTCNAKMTPAQTREYCKLDDASKAAMEKGFESMGLSARAYDKVLRVARTIADLDHSENIKKSHIFEALQYRSLDKKYFSGR